MAHQRILSAAKRFNTGHPLMRAVPGLPGPSLAMLHGAAAVGFAANGQQVIPYAGGIQTFTPLGTAGKSGSTSNPIYLVQAADISLVGVNTYTFLAFGACANTGMMSAFDQDNGSTRRVQFRMNAGKLELIVFDGSNNVLTTVTPASAMSAAECAAGFLMMGTVQPGRAAIVQGRTIVETAIGTPGGLTSAQINIGSRVTGTQGWVTGGLSFVIVWPRALTTAELMVAAADPTSFLEWDDDYDMLVVPSVATGTAASLTWTEDSDSVSVAVRAADAAAISWTEVDDATSVAANALNRAAAAWSEANDQHTLAASASDASTITWTEADDIHALVAAQTDRISISWAESNDSHTLAGTVQPNQSTNISAALSWVEADDAHTLAGALRNRAVASWVEADDGHSLVAVLRNRAAVAWTEADDVHRLVANSTQPGGLIDAALVPANRRVLFQSASRMVKFTASERKVRFVNG